LFLVSINEQLELPKVLLQLLDVVIVALELAPPELAADRLEERAVHPDVPPFPAGDPHAALHLVDDVAGVVLDVECAQLVRGQEAQKNGVSWEEVTAGEITLQAEQLGEIITGWDLEDEFSQEAIVELVRTCTGAPKAVTDAYQAAYNPARLGN